MAKCTKCDLSKYRRKQVKGRGSLPCDILFIGEGPGKSEDARGLPFIGPSGRTLAIALEKATKQADMKKMPKIYITNTVQCRPCDGVNEPNREPTIEEFMACRFHLERIYINAMPIKIVFLGKVAEKFLKRIYPGSITLQHPAYINRRGGIGSPSFVAFVRELSNIFKEVENEKV